MVFPHFGVPPNHLVVQVVTLKVVSLNLGKRKYFFIIENKVTESMTMVIGGALWIANQVIEEL